jgi:hypothetical protein
MGWAQYQRAKSSIDGASSPLDPPIASVFVLHFVVSSTKVICGCGMIENEIQSKCHQNQTNLD